MLQIEPSFLLSILLAQQEKINALNEKLSVDSQNSSKPPSQDFKFKKKKFWKIIFRNKFILSSRDVVVTELILNKEKKLYK